MFFQLNLFGWRARTQAAACLVLLVLNAQVAFGQAFVWDKVDPAFEKLTAVSASKNVKTQIVMGTRLSSNRQVFEDWYRKYLFPAMASTEHLGDVYANRDSLAKDLERCVDPATHQILLDLAYEEASKRATGNYHPAVRFNALLIIGKLNQVEVRRAERLPPIRFPKALDFLLTEYKKADQIDVIRLAAMVGIERHLQLVRQRPQDQPIADGTKAEIASLMEALALEKLPPANRDEKVHTWLRRRAIDILAAIGQVGDSQSVFNALVAIAGDSDQPLSLRCTAARAIGDLDYAGVTGVDPLVTAQKLGALVAAACRIEDTWVKEKQKELKEAKSKPGMGYGGMGGGYPGMEGGGGGYPGMEGEGGYGMEGEGGYGMEGEGGYGMEGEGGYGMDSGYGYGGAEPAKDDDETRLLNNARRRVKTPIYFAQLGIRGKVEKSYTSSNTEPQLGSVAQLADENQKKEIEQILAALDELLAATDLVDDGLDELMTQVRTKTRDLEAVLPESVAADPAGVEEDNSLPGADLPGADLPAAAGAEPGKTK